MGKRGGDRRSRAMNSTITSNCGNLKVRGNANQLAQKYRELARETEDESDRERYQQQAEHYQRIIDEKRARKNDD